MKTAEGYIVEGFRKLPNPIYKGNLSEPHIYEGTIIDVPLKDGKIEDRYTTWDKYGCCSNQERFDCFIDVTGI